MADYATSILLLDLKFVISPMFHLTFQGQISESILLFCGNHPSSKPEIIQNEEKN